MHHLVIHYSLIVHTHCYYRGKDCMKKFCKDLRTHATKIINYEKTKMISLTTKGKIHYNEQEICYICKKEFNTNDKKIIK